MYPTKKLWEVCEILDNKRIPISSKEREKRIANKGILYPYYWATQQNWFIDDYIFDEELVLLWEDGVDFLNPKKTKAYLISGKTWVNNHAHVLKWLDGILNNTFLLHFLNIFDYFWIVSGTTRLKLNQSAMKNIPIPLPPLSTQKLIVEKLDAIFAEIEKSKNLLEKNLENLEEMNKSILEKIFSNEEWERKKLGEVCEIGPKKNEILNLEWNTIVSFVPMKDLNENEKLFDVLEQKKVKEVYKWYTYFAENDVLLAKVTPCFENGKAGIAKNLLNNIWFGSSEFYVLRAKENVSSEYIYYAIKQERFLRNWKNNMSGAVWLQRVTKDFVKNFQIPLPPLSKQKEIVSYLDKIFVENTKLKNLYTRQLKDLDELKQSILKKAFDGELV